MKEKKLLHYESFPRHNDRLDFVLNLTHCEKCANGDSDFNFDWQNSISPILPAKVYLSPLPIGHSDVTCGQGFMPISLIRSFRLS